MAVPKSLHSESIDRNHPVMDSSAQLALALRQIDGVGRVTTRKMVRAFESYDSLVACPFEQLLHRLKGIANASSLAKTMRSQESMQPFLDDAAERLTALQEKGVHLLTSRHTSWPDGLRNLPRNHQPDVLYAYGPLESLQKKRIAFFGAESLESEPFEAAQALIRPLSDYEALPTSGCQTGFDVVIHKRASSFRGKGSIMVAHVGLSRIPKPFRPVASGSVRSGGVMLSSFPMDHGPFDHDDIERAYLQAGLADVCLFFDASPGSPEARVLSWISGHDKPVYAWPDIVDENLEGVSAINPDHILIEVTHNLTA